MEVSIEGNPVIIRFKTECKFTVQMTLAEY